MTMDNNPPTIYSSEDMALMVMVDREGVANVQAPFVTRCQAVQWMRLLTKQFAENADEHIDGCVCDLAADIGKAPR